MTHTLQTMTRREAMRYIERVDLARAVGRLDVEPNDVRTWKPSRAARRNDVRRYRRFPDLFGRDLADARIFASCAPALIAYVNALRAGDR